MDGAEVSHLITIGCNPGWHCGNWCLLVSLCQSTANRMIDQLTMYRLPGSTPSPKQHSCALPGQVCCRAAPPAPFTVMSANSTSWVAALAQASSWGTCQRTTTSSLQTAV